MSSAESRFFAAVAKLDEMAGELRSASNRGIELAALRGWAPWEVSERATLISDDAVRIVQSVSGQEFYEITITRTRPEPGTMCITTSDRAIAHPPWKIP